MRVVLILLLIGGFSVQANPVNRDQSTAKPLTEIPEANVPRSKLNEIDESFDKVVDDMRPDPLDLKDSNNSDPSQFKQILRNEKELQSLVDSLKEINKLNRKRMDMDKDILVTAIRDYLRAQKDKQRVKHEDIRLNNQDKYQRRYSEEVEGDAFEPPRRRYSRQQPNEEPLKLPNDHVLRAHKQNSRTEQDKISNTSYEDKITELISMLEEEMLVLEFRKEGLNDMTEIFKKIIKDDNDVSYSKDDHPHLDSDTGVNYEVSNSTDEHPNLDSDTDEDYEAELSDYDNKVMDTIIIDIKRLLNTHGSKSVQLGRIIKIIKYNIADSFTIPPADMACWQRSLEYLINEVSVAYLTYLYNSECPTPYDDMKGPRKIKQTRFDVKNREDDVSSLGSDVKLELLPGSQTHRQRLKSKMNRSSSSSLINELMTDDMFYNEMFEFGLPSDEKQNGTDSDELLNKSRDSTEIKTNIQSNRLNCEQSASEQLLLAIEGALLRFLLYPRCKETEANSIDNKEPIDYVGNPTGKIVYPNNLVIDQSREPIESLSYEDLSDGDRLPLVDDEIKNLNYKETIKNTTKLISNDKTHNTYSGDKDNDDSDNNLNIHPDSIILIFEDEHHAIPINNVVGRKEREKTKQSRDGRSLKKDKDEFQDLRDLFKMNSATKIKEKLHALKLSDYSKVIDLDTVEKILKAFFVKLPPVLEKILAVLKARLEINVLSAKDLLKIITHEFIQRKGSSRIPEKMKMKQRDTFKDLTKYRQRSINLGKQARRITDKIVKNKYHIDKSNAHSKRSINLSKAGKSQSDLLRTYNGYPGFDIIKDTADDDDELFAKIETESTDINTNEFNVAAEVISNGKSNNSRNIRSEDKESTRRQRIPVLSNSKEESMMADNDPQ